MNLFEHQIKALKDTAHEDHCGYMYDMGLGKTFIGSEKMNQLGNSLNILICQKSKIDDWVEHFCKYYPTWIVVNFPKDEKRLSVEDIKKYSEHARVVMIVNYELAWRRPQIRLLTGCCLMLDESSLIQNYGAKQTKFILSLSTKQVILLSGTPCSGKYENLWTQLRLLGYPMSKTVYERTYVNWDLLNVGVRFVRVPNKQNPYKNVERLKKTLRDYGCVFMKTEECFTLPEQTFIPVKVKNSKLYRDMVKDRVVTVERRELVGSTMLSLRMALRQICGSYSKEKLQAFEDLLDSTNDRLIVFYNFDIELGKLLNACEKHHKPVSVINGQKKDLTNYENASDSVTLCQYQAGAMGLNLQKANKVIYFTLPERSDLFEQSKKRIHRIGQTKPCFYYVMTCDGTIENGIMKALERKEDYTNELFQEEMGIC